MWRAQLTKYPLHLYLINNVKNIVVFLALFISDNFLHCFCFTFTEKPQFKRRKYNTCKYIVYLKVLLWKRMSLEITTTVPLSRLSTVLFNGTFCIFMIRFKKIINGLTCPPIHVCHLQAISRLVSSGKSFNVV